jgi:hypothetical protein
LNDRGKHNTDQSSTSQNLVSLLVYFGLLDTADNLLVVNDSLGIKVKLVVSCSNVESKHNRESINENHILADESSVDLSSESTLGLQFLQFSKRNAVSGNHQECDQKEKVVELFVNSLPRIFKLKTQIDLIWVNFCRDKGLKVDLEEVVVAQEDAPRVELLENHNENCSNYV